MDRIAGLSALAIGILLETACVIKHRRFDATVLITCFIRGFSIVGGTYIIFDSIKQLLEGTTSEVWLYCIIGGASVVAATAQSTFRDMGWFIPSQTASVVKELATTAEKGKRRSYNKKHGGKRRKN